MQLLADRAQMAGAGTARQPLLQISDWTAEERSHCRSARAAAFTASPQHSSISFSSWDFQFSPHGCILQTSAKAVGRCRASGGSLWSLGGDGEAPEPKAGCRWLLWTNILEEVGQHKEGSQDTSPVPACTAQSVWCVPWVSCGAQSPSEPASASEGTYTDQQWQEAPAGLAAGSGIRAQSGTWQCSTDLSSLKSKPFVCWSQVFSGLDSTFSISFYWLCSVWNPEWVSVLLIFRQNKGPKSSFQNQNQNVQFTSHVKTLHPTQQPLQEGWAQPVHGTIPVMLSKTNGHFFSVKISKITSTQQVGFSPTDQEDILNLHEMQSSGVLTWLFGSWRKLESECRTPPQLKDLSKDSSCRKTALKVTFFCCNNCLCRQANKDFRVHKFICNLISIYSSP